MAYSEELADRVREVLDEQVPFSELKMFGGLCFTVNGNMTLGVVKDDLMVRVGADAHEQAMAKPGARPMDFAKKPMAGFVFVDASGTKTKAALRQWAKMALAFNETLPPKAAKPAKRVTRK